MPNLILASTSSIRQQLCAQAGLNVTCHKADICERALERSWARDHLTPPQLAARLAEAKAISVSRLHPNAVVIGADQTLDLNGIQVHKASTLQDVRNHLRMMRGKTHHIHSAVTVARNGERLDTAVESAAMTMWDFSDAFLEEYLATEGEKVKASVGCYQMEGKGITLFDTIVGNYHTILGMPLLPLLKMLRRLEATPQ